MEIIAEILSIFIAKKHHPVGHKLYRTFHYYVAVAQNRGLKVVVLT